jgi:hypothetical protein
MDHEKRHTSTDIRGAAQLTAIIALRDGPWSLERLKDELGSRLAVDEHYYQQVKDLIYKIPVCEPVPAFIVSVSDLSERIRTELEVSTKKGRYEVLRESVGRLFENIDYNYFHLSVKKRLIVELR